MISPAHCMNSNRTRPISRQRLLFGLAFIVLGVAISIWSNRSRYFGPNVGNEVILYCAQDQMFAEPVLEAFTRETGIRLRSIYDSEAVKTVGLANRLIAEKDRPACDVFWGNESLRTRQLAARGVFGTNAIVGANGRGWIEFGSRSRRIIINPSLLSPEDAPASLIELTNARWAGRISLAFPLFGTTSTHFLALRSVWGEAAWEEWCTALMANRPFIEEGNAHVVRRIGRGEAWIGLTDSDDITAGHREGWRVERLSITSDMLIIPNTLAAVRPMAPDSPAVALINFLTSHQTRELLMQSGALESADIPPASEGWLTPDWDQVLESMDEGTESMRRIFRR